MPSFNVVALISMTITVWPVSVLLLQSGPVDAAMFIIAEKVLSNMKLL